MPVFGPTHSGRSGFPKQSFCDFRGKICAVLARDMGMKYAKALFVSPIQICWLPYVCYCPAAEKNSIQHVEIAPKSAANATVSVARKRSVLSGCWIGWRSGPTRRLRSVGSRPMPRRDSRSGGCRGVAPLVPDGGVDVGAEIAAESGDRSGPGVR
ncbi:hypothetical protein [Nocardia beijingensis]|uniref:hypothetical protein n=1 Tax=Nocardia beijingensis TaxID=95162 RepID=UPI0012F4ED86|nr:hypothetical protein [Nocardia beijingensis]